MATKKAPAKKVAPAKKPVAKPIAKKPAPAKGRAASPRMPQGKAAPKAIAKKPAPAKKAVAKPVAKKSAPAQGKAASPRTPQGKAAPKAIAKPVAKKPAPAKKAVAKPIVKKSAPAQGRAASPRMPQGKAAPKAIAKPVAKKPASKKASSKKPSITFLNTVQRNLPKRPISLAVLGKPDKALTKAELAKFHKALLALREKVYRSVDTARQNVKHHNEADNGGDDGASIFDKFLALERAGNTKDILNRIDEALGRIDEGSYGKCLSCGNPIRRVRLEVQPFSKYCIKCQELLEKERENERRR